jgi:anti-sigma B factor antagonist
LGCHGISESVRVNDLVSDDRQPSGGAGNHPLLSVQVAEVPGQVVIALEGELDVSTAPLLHEVLRDATVESSNEIVLDLSALSFVDSTGLSLLVSANKRAVSAGEVFILRDAQPTVMRVLDVTGLTSVFRLEGVSGEDVGEA